MTTSRRRPHHHGNLRAVLIGAALEHVRHHGAASFSLRDATSAAGVTSAAAYRHFASRAHLLAEVVVLGFAELSASMLSHASRHPDGAPLPVTGEACIDFARREPHLFALMFGPDGATARRMAAVADIGAPSAARQLRAERQHIGSDREATFLQPGVRHTVWPGWQHQGSLIQTRSTPRSTPSSPAWTRVDHAHRRQGSAPLPLPGTLTSESVSAVLFPFRPTDWRRRQVQRTSAIQSGGPEPRRPRRAPRREAERASRAVMIRIKVVRNHSRIRVRRGS